MIIYYTLDVTEHLETNIPSFEDCAYPKDKYVWSEYIDYVDKLNVKLFDVVLIDGRARTDCAYKVLNYIDKGSIVFIHDFFQDLSIIRYLNGMMKLLV